MAKHFIGVDLSGTGACTVTEGFRIVDVLKYPEPIFDVARVKEIDKEIKEKKDLPRTITLITKLKAERKAIKRKATRDYKRIYDFLYKYKDKVDVVVIEEPLRQVSFGSTSSDTLCTSHITLGVYTAILSVLEMKYVLYMPTDWHQQFEFKFKGKLTQKERREQIKIQSIQFAKEMFSNMDEFLIRKGCKKEDDNIAESAILSLVHYYKENNIIYRSEV